MKNRLLLLTLFFVLFVFSCSLFKTTPTEDTETANLTTKAPSEKPSKIDSPTLIPSDSEQIQQITTQVSAPVKTTSADRIYVINELTFEVKKLSAELKHLRSELQDVQAKSQMWMNPLAMYNKEIITNNGTSIFGKIIYQDDKIIKVETLIGYLVLNKEDIVRVITNIPETPAEQYIPEEISRDMQTTPFPTQLTEPTYISKAGEPAQITEKSFPAANCVLVGNIKEKKDRSGNTIFSGEIKNIGNKRADFVKANFIFRKNWSGDTQTRTTFVEGSYYTFEQSGITSNNSILPGASGTFELIIPKSFGTFIGYSYTIDWEQYD